MKTPNKMIQHGSRIYCHKMTGEEQKWMIDRLGQLIDVECEDKETLRCKVKRVNYDRAILEIIIK